MAGFRWTGKNTVDAAVKQKLISKLGGAGEFLRAQIVAKISISGEGGPSAPGEPPRVQTGNLRRSIFSRVEADRLRVIVGTSANYGLELEKGTAKMAPRPYLESTLNENMEQIKKAITQ